jgi:hypothetical protein
MNSGRRIISTLFNIFWGNDYAILSPYINFFAATPLTLSASSASDLSGLLNSGSRRAIQVAFIQPRKEGGAFQQFTELDED